MKKKYAKEVEKYDHKGLSAMTAGEILEAAMRIIPEGERFKSCAYAGDRDWWHVVGYLQADEPHGGVKRKRPIVIVRSWNRYKKTWIYKCAFPGELLFCLHLHNEYMD